MSRKKAREDAMCLLFEYLLTGETDSDTLELMGDVLDKENLREEDVEYINTLINLSKEKQDELDEIIKRHTVKWDIDRLPKLDLAMLRLALAEIIYIDNVPAKVSIHEFIELAKRYSTENSYRYINGILGAYIKECSLQV